MLGFSDWSSNWLIIFILAILVDSIAGHEKFLGRLGTPYKSISYITTILENRLNRVSRSPSIRNVRGILVLATLLPAAFVLGLYFNSLIQKNQIFLAISIIILARTLAWRSAWTKTLVEGEAPYFENSSPNHNPVYEQARVKITVLNILIANLTAHFSSRVIGSGVIFILGGFSYLLPYLVLFSFKEDEAKNYPQTSAYHTSGFLAFQAVTTPIAILAAIIISIACFLTNNRGPEALRSIIHLPKTWFSNITLLDYLSLHAFASGTHTSVPYKTRTGYKTLPSNSISQNASPTSLQSLRTSLYTLAVATGVFTLLSIGLALVIR